MDAQTQSVGNDVHAIVASTAVSREEEADPIARAKRHRATRPDHQLYDEVRITTEPRFKKSFASGDEWRISARTQLLLKGVVIREAVYSNVVQATDHLPVLRYSAVYDRDDCEETQQRYKDATDHACDQEGCRQPAETWFKIVKTNCDKCGHDKELFFDRYRGFCGRHVVRGTQSYTDSDECYQYYAGVPVNHAKQARRQEDESHSKTMFI